MGSAGFVAGLPSGEESSEPVILFKNAESTFNLDRTVHSEKNAFIGTCLYLLQFLFRQRTLIRIQSRQFPKAFEQVGKKALPHIRSCFFKRSCCRGMIRCRFVLQQPHKPDVGFARFFYSSARENSLHVCIYNNRKHNLRVNLSPPPDFCSFSLYNQLAFRWFLSNLIIHESSKPDNPS